jgi:site-specific recombinase XerD
MLRQGFPERRDEAMIRLLLDCGVRVSELCGLTVEGVNLDQGMALVDRKGSKIRPIYFGARTAQAVDRYIRTRRTHRWAHLDTLFLPSAAHSALMALGSGSSSAAHRRASPTCTRTDSGTRSRMTS